MSVGIAGRGATGAGDDRDLDVALLEPQPRLVERPRAVHLHVRVALRRPRADRVEVRHERERLAGDVVARAEAGEVDVGAGEAERLERVGDHAQQQLGLGEVGAADHRASAPTRRPRCRCWVRSRSPSEDPVHEVGVVDVGLAARDPADEVRRTRRPSCRPRRSRRSGGAHAAATRFPTFTSSTGSSMTGW